MARAGESRKLDILFAVSENALGNKKRKSPLISSVQWYKKIQSWGHLRSFYFCLQLLGKLIMTIQSERMADILMKNTNLNDTFVVCD